MGMHKPKKRNVLVIIFLNNLAWALILGLLLWGLDHQKRTGDALLQSKNGTISFLAKVIRGQRWDVDRAQLQMKGIKALEFRDTVFMTSDPNLHRIADLAWIKGQQYKLNPYLIMAVIHRESYFDRLAKSKVAYGLMQVNYEAWKDELKIDKSRLQDPEYNMDLGCRILKGELDASQGNLALALFLYWGGKDQPYSYSVRVLNSKFFNVLEGVAGGI